MINTRLSFLSVEILGAPILKKTTLDDKAGPKVRTDGKQELEDGLRLRACYEDGWVTLTPEWFGLIYPYGSGWHSIS